MEIDVATIQYLCFGVGGTNGWVFVGLLLALERELKQRGLGLQQQLKGASGASVGSLMALAVVLDYGAIELREFLKRATAKHRHRLLKINISDISKHKGLISTDVIEDVSRELIAQKLGEDHADITLEMLHSVTKREFIVATHNQSLMKGQLFDHRNAPDLAVSHLIAMSCAIPSLFHMVQYNGHGYSDAALSNALPFEVFPLKHQLVFNVVGHHDPLPPSKMSWQDFLCRTTHTHSQHTLTKIAGVDAELRPRIVSIDIPCLMQFAVRGVVLTDDNRDMLIDIGLRAGIRMLYYKIVAVAHAAAYYHIIKCNLNAIADAPPPSESQ